MSSLSAVRSRLVVRVGACVIYVAVAATCVAAVVTLIRAGDTSLGSGADVGLSLPAAAAAGGNVRTTLDLIHTPLAVLMLQLLVILGVARLFARGARALRQPPVVGELAAGIVLGPSLLGHAFPDLSAFVFRTSSLPLLSVIGEVGVVIYMFVVGLELDAAQLRQRARTAVAVSHASIVVPFMLGTVLAFPLYARYANPGSSFTAFALFMGIAMSITAFPVLARLLEERQLSSTTLGTTALACAAVDDVTAWMLLAVIVALVTHGNGAAFLLPLAWLVVFGLFMVFAVRPVLRLWLNRQAESFVRDGLPVVLWLIFAAALTTEIIGVHALIGAFIAGTVMPAEPGWRRQLRERIERFSATVFLPVFFVSTGLRTDLGLIADWTGWLVFAAVIVTATAGKLLGGMLTARWTGMTWSDSLRLGALMNTRGLMELVALNLGYDLGILSRPMFTVLAMMALVTTAMTSPLLDLSAWQVRPARMPSSASVGG